MDNPYNSNFHLCKLKLCGHLWCLYYREATSAVLFIADGPFSHRLISSLLWTAPTNNGTTPYTCVYVYFSPFCSNMSKRCQNSLTPHYTHAYYIWLQQHSCRWSSNTINWLIATYFLFLLTNKLHYRFSLFNYLQEMIKRRAVEVHVKYWS